MIRFLLILTSLLAMQCVYGQDGASISSPTYYQQPCTGVFCGPKTTAETVKLLNKAVEECEKCKCKKSGKIDWEILCDWYTNWNQQNQMLLNCIINRFNNPCYDLYHEMQATLNKNCNKVCQYKQFSFYTLISDICYYCNACLIGCSLQTYNIYWYQAQGPVGAVAMGGGATDAAAAGAPAAPPKAA